MEAIKSQSITRVVVLTVGILLIPLVAMQFTDEVNWNLADFIIVSVILLGAGFVYEFAVKKLVNTKYRAVSAAVLLAFVLLIWAELAVGIFNTSFSGS